MTSNRRVVVTGLGATTPVGGTAPETWEAVLAGRSGARTMEFDWVAKYELPVYFYARAARRADREKLADVRRGQYEGLKVEIDQRGREPDAGPARLHPSAGAVAVGARPFLIAFAAAPALVATPAADRP